MSNISSEDPRVAKNTLASLIGEAYSYRLDHATKSILSLSEEYIRILRANNDTASPDEVKFNQGAIHAFKLLIDNITHGVIGRQG